MVGNEHPYYKEQKKKSFALVLMLMICILSSVCFIAAEAEHDCIGEDCPVCASLLQCEELVQKLGTWIVFLTVCGTLFFHQIIPVNKAVIQLPAATPVKLKIQLNN